MADLILPRERLELALTRITVAQREALEVAAERVRSYHEKQKQGSGATPRPTARCSASRSPCWTAPGFMCRRQGVLPVLGADECDPGQGRRGVRSGHGRTDPARRDQRDRPRRRFIAGVDRVFTIGGGRPWPRLGYGTESVPRWTRSSAPATSTWPPPSVTCSARSAST